MDTGYRAGIAGPSRWEWRRYHSAAASLATMDDAVKAVERQTVPPGDAGQAATQGLFDRMKQYVFDDAAREALKAAVAQLRDQLAGYARSTVDLITVFVIQTVVIPLAFLWMGAQLIKALIRTPLGWGAPGARKTAPV